MKTCTKCKVTKDESEFNLRSGSQIGRKPRCKSCTSEDNLKYYYLDHEASLKRDRESRDNNRAEHRLYHRAYYVAHREENRSQQRAYKKEWSRQRRRGNPNFRMTENLRSRVSTALSAAGAKKSARTIELIGCPIVWLEVHLESLFHPGMTHNNYGPVWHIDHIKPCALFDLTDPEQQRICFHWTNLQPLFARDNILKGDTYHG